MACCFFFITFDATFWVTISFFIFIGILIYFKIPQKVKTILEQNILDIKNQISEAEKLKEDAKNILIDHEKKISHSKNEVKEMLDKEMQTTTDMDAQALTALVQMAVQQQEMINDEER